jgi:hypothetical protein
MRALRTITTCALLVALVAGVIGAPAAAQSQQADLAIEQPSYVSDDVERTTEGGDVIYRASGEELLIRVNNADHANITDVQIQNGPGSISYDATLGLYRLNTEGQTGSSTVVFSVAENGTATELRAIIQVDNVAWAHRGAEADQQLQEKADKWEQVESEAGEVDPEEDPEQVVSDALTYARFLDSPLQGLTESLRGALVILVFTPGGWIILAMFLGLSLYGVASSMRYRNRTQKQLADAGDIQVEKDKAYLNKVRESVLQQNDWNQLFPDDVARANRELFGRNVWQGVKQFALLWSPRSVRGTVLQMMGQAGWVGYAIRGADDELIEAGIAEADDPANFEPPTPEVDVEGVTAETMDLCGLDFEADGEWIDAIGWQRLDDSVFQLDRDQIDIDDVHLPISNREIDDAAFMDRVNPEFTEDFKDEEHFARVCGEVLDFALEHDHTDELGRPREEMDLISYNVEMASILTDDGGFPTSEFQRNTFFWIAENLQAEDEVSETVDRINRDAAGSDPSGGEPA